MSYTPTVWKSGDIVTSLKLNKLENGLATAAAGVDEVASAININAVPLVQGKYLALDGSERAASPVDTFSTSDYIAFTENDSFELLNFANSAYASYSVGYAFYTIDKAFISGSGNFDGSFSSSSIVIPANTAYVRFCTRTQDSPNAKAYVNNEHGISAEAARELEQNFSYGISFTTNSYINNQGGLSNSAAFSATDLIPFTKKDKFTLYGFNSASWDYAFPFAFYDANRGFISGGSRFDGYLSSDDITIPTNTAYVCFSTRTQYAPDASISIRNEYGISAETSFAAMPTTGKSILIFGDSITQTATVSDDGTSYTEGTRRNWPTYAKPFLQIETMYNFAESGAAYTDRDNVDNRQKISHQITSAISSGRSGDIIVISAGTNDPSTNIGSYETAMAKETLSALDRTVLYEAIRWAMWTIRSTFKDAICFAATPIQRADREPRTEVREAIISMANRYNFIVIDAEYDSGIVRENNVWNAEGNDLADGLHPNDVGIKKMSSLYSAVIKGAFCNFNLS